MLKNLFTSEKFYLGLILVLAAFLRLYRIGDYLTFLGDEGRDVLIAKAILGGDLTLLGPRASAGDFFLGPVYYYFITPFLFLFNYDPVGPAVMVGIVGVLTVLLVYLIGKRFYSVKAGLFAAALYAVSPLVIAYSRSSWNPNIMPFFSMITLIAAYRGVVRNSLKYILLSGFLLGISMQLHYLSVFLGAILFFYLISSEIFTGKKYRLLLTIKRLTVVSVGFLLGLSPFLLFEVRHGFPNTKTIFSFIFDNTFEKEYTGSQSFLQIINDVFFRLFGRLIFRFPPPEQLNQYNQDILQLWSILIYATGILSFAAVCYLLYRYIKQKDFIRINQYLLLILWFSIGIGLFGIYKKPIYDYYFGFIFPLPFIFLSNLVFLSISFIKNKTMGYAIALTIFLSLLVFNLMGAPFFHEPNRQKDQVKAISEFVLSKTDGKPFNFALLTQGNSDHAYRYFLSIGGREPVTIENPQVDPDRKTVTDQLLIVCEDVNCQPLGNPLWEVSGFGRAEIAGEWDVSVVKVYRLVPYKEN